LHGWSIITLKFVWIGIFDWRASWTEKGIPVQFEIDVFEPNHFAVTENENDESSRKIGSRGLFFAERFIRQNISFLKYWYGRFSQRWFLDQTVLKWTNLNSRSWKCDASLENHKIKVEWFLEIAQQATGEKNINSKKSD